MAGVTPQMWLGTAAASQGIGSIGSGIAGASAAKGQAEYQKTMSDMNAKIADYQATDAIKRGDLDSARAFAKGQRTIGAQRAAAGAQGIDPNSGSARDLQTDTEAMSALDQITIKNNAMREAFGYKSQSLAASAQGRMYAMAGDNQARNTLLTGGIRSLGYGLDAGGYFSGGSDKGLIKRSSGG